MQKFSELQYQRPDIGALRSALTENAARLETATSFEESGLCSQYGCGNMGIR